ncbi:HD domain-containing protein [Alkaliphilus crotonatoxidans]
MVDVIACICEIQRMINKQVFVVGGTIRDQLLQRPFKDLDLAVLENAADFAQLVADRLNAAFFVLDEVNQVYRVVDKENHTIDISIIKNGEVVHDLYQRDFTINAMAYDLSHGWPIKEEHIIDPFEGKTHIQLKQIKSLHDKTFYDDPVRMLRAVRFMSVLGFSLEETTLTAIQQYAEELKRSPGERITRELFTILEGRDSHYFLHFLDEPLHLLDKLFPELQVMKDVGQCKYHVVDCWSHSIYTVKILEGFIHSQGYFEAHIKRAYEEHTSQILAGDRSRLALIKLGALFHDVGKPSARQVDQTGRTRFRGHEITGAEILKGYAERLKLSAKETEILYRYVAYHMIPLDLYKANDVSGRVLYDVFRKMGEETLDILLIALADIIATRTLLDPKEEMGMFKIHVEYIINNYLTRYKPVERVNNIINGKEIMESLKLPQSIMIGTIIEEIKKALYLGQIPPTKRGALDYIKKNYF